MLPWPWTLLGPALALGLLGCSLNRQPLPPDGGPDAGARPDGGADLGALPDEGPDLGPPDLGPDMGRPDLPLGGLILQLSARNVNGNGTPADERPTVWWNLTGRGNAACADVLFEEDGLGAGHPAIRTTGVIPDPGLGVLPSRCLWERPALSSFTLAVVLRTDDDRGAEPEDWPLAPTIFGADNPTGRRDGALFLHRGRPGFAYASESGLGVLAPTRIDDDQPHLLVLVRDNILGTLSVRIDRGEPLALELDRGMLDQPLQWILGSNSDEEAGRFAGRYGEVLLYDIALDADVAEDLRTHLLLEWGL
ncbi:MAG: hypothetical protein ACFCGT_28535 [Sandaracinaceae bacterium]